MDRKTPHAGSLFDDFLKEEGHYEEATATALKRVLARQIADAMEQQHITKVDMARRLNTSRSQLDRLLDPDNEKVQLDTLQRAAAAIGRTLQIDLVVGRRHGSPLTVGPGRCISSMTRPGSVRASLASTQTR